MKEASQTVWQAERLADYARTEARLLETIHDPYASDFDRETQEMLFLWKLYLASGSPFGGGIDAVVLWRRFLGMTTAN